MSNIFTPKKEEDYFTPFGPAMGYKKMSTESVKKFNSLLDENLEDFSNNLVGKVKQELKFTDEIQNVFLKEFSQYIGKYMSFSEVRNSFGKRNLDSTKYDYGIQIKQGWFVRQFDTEYNPLHIHSGAALSCVGYLALPKGIDKEWEEDYKDHHPSHGHIQFAHGSPCKNGSSAFVIKPQVGDFYIFPADLFHCVYPFYTKGERRSFSVNLDFLEIIRDKKVDKQ
tara:strand:+ start:2233 stop:2904 length:672 start_codon:yes stop_codon:yes gene_type:complete